MQSNRCGFYEGKQPNPPQPKNLKKLGLLEPNLLLILGLKELSFFLGSLWPNPEWVLSSLGLNTKEVLGSLGPNLKGVLGSLRPNRVCCKELFGHAKRCVGRHKVGRTTARELHSTRGLSRRVVQDIFLHRGNFGRAN